MTEQAVGVSGTDELANFIFHDKYARYNEKAQRRETWNEAVGRVQDMHTRKFVNTLSAEQLNDINKAFDLVREKKVLPSMRTLQFGGIAVEKNNARAYNCAVRHVDSIDAFSELFFLLLSGCGVGIGITYRHLSRLPKLIDLSTLMEVSVVVEDSIEGWADSLKTLLSSYFEGNPLSGRIINFDYSKIRPKGSPLKTSGGLAPGPDGLRFAHEKIREILDSAIGQQRIKSIQVYDILMHVADAVLSGGVRRAACSVLFDKSDIELLSAKAGDWSTKNPQRARSNNSVVLLRKTTTLEDLKEIVEYSRQWGEPGFVFADHQDTLYNPCFEVGFLPITESGKCGVQFCNLTTINGTKIKTKEDWFIAAKAAAIIGTLQATYTDFHYLSREAKELTEDEALLGVSPLSCMANSPVLLDPQIQREAAKIVVDTNRYWAKLLGINQAARTTLVKPDGTVALCMGTMLSGIHPAHAHQMFRRVQVNKQDPVYQFFKQHNPELCEESKCSATGTDDVITFPITVPSGAIVKSDLTALQHLEIIRRTQNNWVLPGTTKANRKPLSHNVSCTVQVEDYDSVVKYLFENKDAFSAVSLVPKSNDKDFVQAPMEAVSTMEDLRRFHFLRNQLESVDYTQMVENKDVTTGREQFACVGQLSCGI
jgi:ribonucleoside-diphosphate reductase alpha chain